MENENWSAAETTAAPLDVWAILRNEITYTLPLIETHADTDAYYVDPKARIPAMRGVDAQVARALPLVVPAGLGGTTGASGGEYRVKSWPPSLLPGSSCVEVTLRFVRTRSHAVHGEE